LLQLFEEKSMHRMKSQVTFCLLVELFFLASFAIAQQEGTYGPTNPADPALNQGPKEEAIGEKGMVSTQLASSTLAALQVLESGGNAVDAAITAMFVQQVHDYHMVFLFGSMSAIYYDAASNGYYVINAVSGGPDADRGEGGDASVVSIGGTVRGAAALVERFGSRPWASTIEPAIAAAEEGAIVTSFMYGLESRIADETRKGMAARGIKVKDIGAFNFHTGSMQIVWRNPETGKLHGVTDPRRLGHAAGH
jgi:gamma-glutamyltranspeptidase